MDTGQEVCSTREAVDRLGVSLRTVLWTEAGLLRAWKTPGGHRRILKASIDELFQSRAGSTSRCAPGDNYEVLIVEDQPDFRHLFELHLRAWGLPIHLQCVPSGFDALLLIGAISELEINVVTALTDHTIAERGGLPPGVTVLFKPLRFGELRQRLGQLLEHWQRAAAG